jgi:tetratricopeptide (TPR) repeat protein
VVFGLAGVLFGLLVGWMLGSQQARPAPGPQVAAAAPSPAPPAGNQPAPVDEARVAELRDRAGAAPEDAAVRIALGNLYFDARRFDMAMPWYEAAFALDPKNVDVSTDLAVTYFQTSQIDRALAQLDTSLALDANNLKALLNQGIVRASGRSDRQGAAASFQRVITLAPESEEARLAREVLAILDSGHGAPPGASKGGRP